MESDKENYKKYHFYGGDSHFNNKLTRFDWIGTPLKNSTFSLKLLDFRLSSDIFFSIFNEQNQKNLPIHWKEGVKHTPDVVGHEYFKTMQQSWI